MKIFARRTWQKFLCALLSAAMLVPAWPVSASAAPSDGVVVVPEETEPVIVPEEAEDAQDSQDVKLVFQETSVKVFSELSEALRARNGASAARYTTSASDFSFSDGDTAWSKKLDGQKTMFGDKYVESMESPVANSFTLTLESGLEDRQQKITKIPAPDEAYVAFLIDQTMRISKDGNLESVNDGLQSYFNAMRAENAKRMQYARAGFYSDIDPAGDVDVQMEDHLLRAILSMGYNDGQYLRYKNFDGLAVLTQNDVDLMLEKTQVDVSTSDGMRGGIFDDNRIGSAMEAMEDLLKTLPAWQKPKTYLAVFSMYHSTDYRNYNNMAKHMKDHYGSGYPNAWFQLAFNTNLYCAGGYDRPVKYADGQVIAKNFGHDIWSINQINWYLDAARHIKQDGIKIQAVAVNMSHQIDMVGRAIAAKDISLLNTYWYGGILAVTASLSSSDFPVNSHLGVTWSWSDQKEPAGEVPIAPASKGKIFPSYTEDYKGFGMPETFITCGYFGFPSDFIDQIGRRPVNKYGSPDMLYYDFMRGQDLDPHEGNWSELRGWAWDFEDGHYPNELGYYTYLPADAGEMVAVSTQILSQQASAQSDNGYAGSASSIRDELSDVFSIPQGRDGIRVYKVPRIPVQMDASGVPQDADAEGRSSSFRWGRRSYMDGDATKSEWEDITKEVGLTLSGEKTVGVSGFDYELNALTDFNKYGRDHYEPGDYGYKIVVEIDIIAEDTFGGNGIRTNNPENSKFVPSKPGKNSGLPDWKDNGMLNPSGSPEISRYPVPHVDLMPTNSYAAVTQDMYIYAPQTADIHNLIMDENQNIFYGDPRYNELKVESESLKAKYEEARSDLSDYDKELYDAGAVSGFLTEEQQAKLDSLTAKSNAAYEAWLAVEAEMQSCVRCIPDGRNNQFVDIMYHLYDPDGQEIGSMHIPRGRSYTGSNISWDFSAKGTDKRIQKSGNYKIAVTIRPVDSTVSPNGYIYTDASIVDLPDSDREKLVGTSPFYTYYSEAYSATGSRVQGAFKGTDFEDDSHAYLYQLHIKAADTRLVPNQTVDFYEGMEQLMSSRNPHLASVAWVCTDGVTPSEQEREPGVDGSLVVGSGGVQMASTIPERAFYEGLAHKVNAMTACSERSGVFIPVGVQLSRSCGRIDKKLSMVSQVVQTVRYMSDTDNAFAPGVSSVVWEHDCKFADSCDTKDFKNAQGYGTADDGTGAGKIRYLIHVEDNPMPTVEKTTTTPVISRGEEMLWQVKASNNTESENPKHLISSFSLVDVLPYAGDGLVDPNTNYEGSRFAGSLSATSVTLDLSKSSTAKERLAAGMDKVYVTTDVSARKASESQLTGTASSGNVAWTEAEVSLNGNEASVEHLPAGVIAVRYDTELPFGQSVTMRFSANVSDIGAQKNGDRYHNQAGAYNLGGGRLSEVCAVTMTPTSLSGRIWEDLDGNGIADAAEPGIAGVTVTLYQQWTDRNPNAPDRELGGVKLVRVYDLDQDAVPSAVTDAGGNYMFDEVNPGTYYVVADVIPEQFEPVAKKAAGSDPALSAMDSECEESFVSNTNKSLDNTAWIRQVTMKDASIPGQNFGMQYITGEVMVRKVLDEIYYPSSMTDAEREDYQLVFTFRLRDTKIGKEYKQTVRLTGEDFADGTAFCKFKDLPLGTYILSEEPSAQYVLDRFESVDPGTAASGRQMQITVAPATREFDVTAYNVLEKDPPGGDENGVANFVNVRVPVSLAITYTGPDPVGNKSIIKYQFRKSDFADIVVTYDDGTHISLKEGTLRFEDVTLTPSVVTNLMNTGDGKKLTVNGFYSEKGRVVKDSFRVAVDLKPVHKFRLTFDANGSSFDTGSTKNIVNFAYDDNAGYNIVTSGTYRDVANGGLKPYGVFRFAGWNTKDDGTGVNYTDRTALDAIGKNPAISTLTLYAQWSCDITFNANGGMIVKASGVNDSALTAGERAALNKASAKLPWNFKQTVATNLAGSKSGFHFVLWNTKPDGTGTDLADYGACTGPVTFYAVYYQSDYSYVGAPQTFVAPVSGDYQVTLYGAAGGDQTQGSWSNNLAGRGGMVSGIVHLNAGQRLYVWVGGNGRDALGWNGGGRASWSQCTGGGATDIRIAADNGISGRIAVAGGGGGSDDYNRENDGYGGHGGGLVGYPGSGGYAGGTQNSGYALGYGQSSSFADAGGGGGGYYGGYSAGSNNQGGGGGGSSYMSGMPGCAIHYSGIKFRSCTTSPGVREGHGFARIMILSRDKK